MVDEDGARLVVLAPGVTTADVLREARAAVRLRDKIARRGGEMSERTPEEQAAQDLERHRQEMCGRLVAQNVQLCMSSWVEALINGRDGGRDGHHDAEAQDHYYGEQLPDWDDVESACNDAGVYVVEWLDDADGEGGAGTFHDTNGDVFELTTDGNLSPEDAAEVMGDAIATKPAGLYLLEDGMLYDVDGDDGTEDAIRQAAERAGVDPYDYIREIYEWWAVDSWFGRKLAERGEHVVDGEHGGSMWGRTCTGQAIKIDGVVRQIAADLWPEEWATGKERA